MTELECQALLIRYTAALTMVEQLEVDERWALLGAVIYPNEEFEQASLHQAEKVGPSPVARTMARVKARPIPIPEPNPQPARKPGRMVFAGWGKR